MPTSSSIYLLAFYVKCLVYNTCIHPGKHRLMAALKADSSSLPIVSRDISVSVSLSAISWKNVLYVQVVLLVCIKVGPKQIGRSIVEPLITERSL